MYQFALPFKEYKPPCSRDIPEDFRITFSDPLTDKPSGPMGSKCTGEPSTNMAVAVVNAIRSAIQAGQIEVGAADTTTWVPLSKFYATLTDAVTKQTLLGTKLGAKYPLTFLSIQRVALARFLDCLDFKLRVSCGKEGFLLPRPMAQ